MKEQTIFPNYFEPVSGVVGPGGFCRRGLQKPFEDHKLSMQSKNLSSSESESSEGSGGSGRREGIAVTG